MSDGSEQERVVDDRRAWRTGPDPDVPTRSWLALDDEELLHKIETLDPDAEVDLELLAIVRSSRHFFIRQEAAKRIRQRAALVAHVHDRHIGQILVRRLTREEDITYLEDLASNSRHLDVRKAAEAQLLALRRSLGLKEHEPSAPC
jgi:hypothetical protein